MNAIVKPEASHTSQLIAMDPATYVAAVYEPFNDQIKAAIESEPEAYDATTTAGLAVATKRRALFRDIRVAMEAERKARKAPILEIGKLLDSRAKEITAQIEPYEAKHDAAIKAEEARKEAVKAEKARIEAERVAAIAKLVSEIGNAPLHCAGLSVAKHEEVIARIEGLEVTLEAYQERTGEAQQLRDQVLAQLHDMHGRAVAQEAERARLKAEAEALALRQAEQEEAERKAAAERQRLADEQAERLQRQREAEAKRAELLRDIAEVVGTPSRMMGKSHQQMEDARAMLILMDCGKSEFGDLSEQAYAACNEVIKTLDAMILAERQRIEQQAAIAQERAVLRAQQQAIEAERQEMERQKEEAARREREALEAAAMEAAASEEMASDLQEARIIFAPVASRPTLAELAADVASVRGISAEAASDMIVEAVHTAELGFARVDEQAAELAECIG